MMNNQIRSDQPLSRVRLFAIPRAAAHQASLSITNSWSLLKLMPIELVMPFCHLNPLSSPSPPAFNISQHQGLHYIGKKMDLTYLGKGSEGKETA